MRVWYQENKEKILRDFFSFLRFPSISADPARETDVRGCAAWVARYLNQSGFSTEIWETSGMPVVFGTLCEAGSDAPTLLFYHHYDVQPVDPLSLWKSKPFEPEIRVNQVYARGASDNKGQCFYTLLALCFMQERGLLRGLNIKVFVEGEEESGGKGTAALIREKREELQADSLFVVDFTIPSATTPAISLGMRGLVTMEIECRNGFADLHAGIHGGIAFSATQALIQALSQLWTPAGTIAVPGFYDSILDLDRVGFDLSFDEKVYAQQFGVHVLHSHPKEGNWFNPSLEINGISSGYTGPGLKTIIPARGVAKLSCRLVPGQDPVQIAKLITEFLASRFPPEMEVDIKTLSEAPAFRSQLKTRTAQVVASAYETIFGKPCQYHLCGATVPIVADLACVSGAEVVLMGVALDTDDFHAPNEHFSLDLLEKGFLAITTSLLELQHLSP